MYSSVSIVGERERGDPGLYRGARARRPTHGARSLCSPGHFVCGGPGPGAAGRPQARPLPSRCDSH